MPVSPEIASKVGNRHIGIKGEAMEGICVKGLPEERAIQLARYITQHGATVRQTARQFSVSKSTVHKDITVRLRGINYELYQAVQQVLEINKKERHLRGGQATKEKYARMKK